MHLMYVTSGEGKKDGILWCPYVQILCRRVHFNLRSSFGASYSASPSLEIKIPMFFSWMEDGAFPKSHT